MAFPPNLGYELVAVSLLGSAKGMHVGHVDTFYFTR